MKIIDKVWVFDYLMEIFLIMTMVCGQSLLTNSLNPLGYISIHISFIIYCLFYFLPILYFIALWNSDVIDYRKNIILLIILFIFNKLFHGNQRITQKNKRLFYIPYMLFLIDQDLK